jgi:hypothetical protein
LYFSYSTPTVKRWNAFGFTGIKITAHCFSVFRSLLLNYDEALYSKVVLNASKTAPKKKFKWMKKCDLANKYNTIFIQLPYAAR